MFGIIHPGLNRWFNPSGRVTPPSPWMFTNPWPPPSLQPRLQDSLSTFHIWWGGGLGWNALWSSLTNKYYWLTLPTPHFCILKLFIWKFYYHNLLIEVHLIIFNFGVSLLRIRTNFYVTLCIKLIGRYLLTEKIRLPRWLLSN